jgi:hypothetical protein
MRERLYWWALDRPILSCLVRDRPIHLRPINYHVVRHTRFNIYWRDPYKLRSNHTGHLSEWGKLGQAWRFSTVELATRVLSEMSENGIIERYPYDD